MPGVNVNGHDDAADPARARDPLPAAEESATGLPGLRTWPAVYGFVLIVFLGYVVLLVVLERMFQ
jgi:hypothetical protein